MKPTTAFAAALLALAPLAVQAQSFRCVGVDGKKYYGQTVPRACAGQVVEQLNAQGIVVKRIDPAPKPAAGAKPETAEEQRKREAEARDEARRNKALLATYTSEKDLEQARARALEDNKVAIKETEGKIAALKKRHADLTKELKFYEGKTKPPAKLEQDIKGAEFDIKVQEDVLALRKKDADTINAKYDDDKRRYLELTQGKK